MTCMGLLVEVHVQGHCKYLEERVLPALGVLPVLAELGLRFVTFNDLGIPHDINDRALWTLAQAQGWVLFTEDRNKQDPDSLEQTLRDSWTPGDFPVLTLASKSRLEHDRAYADEVGNDLATFLFDIACGKFTTNHDFGSRKRGLLEAGKAQALAAFEVQVSSCLQFPAHNPGPLDERLGLGHRDVAGGL